MYIGGDYIAVKHTIGLYLEGEKIAASGYNQTINNPAINKYYYLIVTNPDSGAMNTNAKLWIRARTA